MQEYAPGEEIPPTADYAGSNTERQRVGLPGHCKRCAADGHVAAHPDLGCGDVGCDRTHDGVRHLAPPAPPGPITVYTWATIADLTGLPAGDVATLTAEWIGEPGYLHGGLPTRATLDLLQRQATDATNSAYLQELLDQGVAALDQPGGPLQVEACVRDRKWGGRYTGTIVRIDDDGDLFVQWHGTFVEDQVRPDEVEPIDMPNPLGDGQRPMVLGG